MSVLAMPQTIPILMYHSIDTDDADRWTLSPTLFAQHMDWLAEHDYRPITVSTLVAARAARLPLPPRTVVITFDDGLRNFLIEAVPILQRHGFPATLYVVTGYVGKSSGWSRSLGEPDRPMLSWSELATVSECGIECGAHTHSHPQLDIISPAAAFAEVQRSKVSLEDHLARKVDSFAYPHGYASRITRQLVRQAGFTSACRVRHALSSTTEDPFALSRIIVTSDTRADDLGALFTGSTLPIAPPSDRPLAIGWRWARKISYGLRHWSERPLAIADCDRSIADNRLKTGGPP
jgi:peptidoglycan/xylan/chitin deacetylase (PgdA/CDA1 family)